MPKINDFLQGFSDGLPGMKDFRHASRLYIDDNYKLMPKQKFLFHVIFDLDDRVAFRKFAPNERDELNMLVKACELPRFNMNIEEKVQYNKKMYTATRVQYDALNIVFHDDHADTVNAFWKKYYEYHIADPVQMEGDTLHLKDDYYDGIDTKAVTKWGMDTPRQRKLSFLRGISIFVLHKQRFTSFRLINPIIGSFNHDNLDAADGTGILANTMQIMYETVVYGTGIIAFDKNKIPGFATIHYDHEPSPLTVFGKGSQSIFGPGGVVQGIGSVMRSVNDGNYLGAILGSINTYNNAKKIKKSAAKEELKGIVKEGVKEFGKQAGTINSTGVGGFNVGSAVALGSAAAVAYANAKGTSDNKRPQDSRVISSAKLDTVTFLTANESYTLITTNSTIKDKIASGIYYKDIGSRNGLTVAESDVEYTGSTDTTKVVYRNKAITNVRKLVTEGYLKINRETQDVSIVTEKANI